MRAVDLFCGCGGLTLGFMNAGFDIVAGFDFWDKAIEVYKENFSHPVVKQDLTDVSESLDKICEYSPEIIIGGPPCQDFSSAGKRDENNGRGGLTVSYANIVSAARPEWFVMENVERIKKTQKLADAVKVYKEAGYGLSCIVLDASLCGVPQKRRRFVMIGHLYSPDNAILPFLTENLAKTPMTLADYFGDSLGIKYYYRHPRSYARRGIFSVDEPSPTIRGVNRPMPEGYVIHPNDPVRTKNGVRALTTKERSLIQTFPDDFVFFGSKTVQEQMIGNAVPVRFGTFIAEAINVYIETAKTSTAYAVNERCSIATSS